MKQPQILRYFFLTEVWERFGFYTVQTLLVLYMVSKLHFTDSKSYTLVGEFTALAYIMPLLGGYLADRVLGYRFSILLGGVLLCSGYACLGVFPSFILLGLALVIMGNGLFKPNISSFLGKFYQENDPRRDSGFTLFYIGINFGSFAASLLAGYIQQWLGWYAAFAIASVGMLIGVITFRASFFLLEKKGLSPRYPGYTHLHRLLLTKPHLLCALVAIIIALFALLNFPEITTHILNVTGIILLIGLSVLAFKQSRIERRHMATLIALLLFAVIFWGLFFQQFFAVNLFTERAVDRTIGSFTIPAVAFIALESVFILLLGPFFSLLWRHINPTLRFMTAPFKFAYALLIIALAFQLLACVIQQAAPGTPISALWLILFYILFVISELLLSPIGLSMITTLSPAKHVGLMMGAWFLTLGYGGALGGLLAQQANIASESLSLAEQTHIYKNAFQHFANFGFVAGAILLIVAPLLTRLMLGKKVK